MTTRIACVLIALAGLPADARGEEPGAAGTRDVAKGAPASPAVQTILEAISGMEARAAGDVWRAAEDLRKEFLALDTAGAMAVSDAVYGLGEKSRLAASVLLSLRGERTLHERGQFALQQLAKGGKDRVVRIAAIRLLRKPALVDPAYILLKSIVDAAEELEIRIEACLAMWEIDNHQSARQPLLKMLEGSGAGEREAAAVALAETGYLSPPVGDILRDLRREPSERGKKADLLLRIAAMEPAPPGPPAPPAKGKPVSPPDAERAEAAAHPRPPDAGAAWALLVDEVVQLIRQHSIQRDKAEPKSLFVAALKGMVASLDEYSGFQDPDDVRQLEAGRLGVQWGLGAQVVKPGKRAPFVIVKPHHHGPAYRAGIRTGDRVLEVNGLTTHDRDPEEIKRLTAGSGGEDGVEVHLLILRWGWDAPRLFTLKHGQIDVPALRVELFPAGIGYLRLARFGPKSAAELEKALDDLEAKGLQALVLDLRDNPGGNLDQAVQIADLFLPEKERPILTERGPAGSRDRFATAGQKPVHPMVILVNRLSASASEVVAGALQDFRRAAVVGQTTYGKGVKQMSIPLSANAKTLLGGDSRVLLTSSTLYLPLGRPIGGEPGKSGAPPVRGGIEPDIKVDQDHESYQGRQLAELTRVQYSPQVMDYVQRHFRSIQHLFEEGDLWDPGQYPGFEELYQSLGTSLTRDDVRFALRSLLRRHLEDERGEDFASDYREDRQLQEAILEALRRLGREPADVPEYRSLADKRRGRSGE